MKCRGSAARRDRQAPRCLIRWQQPLAIDIYEGDMTSHDATGAADLYAEVDTPRLVA